MEIVAVDLFCGAGGLTAGLEQAGISVVEGIDIDDACSFPYEYNTSAKFILKEVTQYSYQELNAAMASAEIRVLVGCAPCQPFSTYTQGNSEKPKKKWGLLEHFCDLIDGSRPDIVSMENVWPLTRHEIFKHFSERLSDAGYYYTYKEVDCRLYGIPQRRRRLVLLASLLGPIDLVEPTHLDTKNWATVRSTISNLPPIKAGEKDAQDPLHVSSSLSPLNLKRMRASVPGGSWRNWPNELVASCHKRDTGSTYPGVYGRMEWDAPSPTITGQCFGFGNGRFGHPQQDRAISLREAALLQTFPRSYLFVPEGKPVHMTSVGRMIGNAVPPKLGQIIGKSILHHIQKNTPDRIDC